MAQANEHSGHMLPPGHAGVAQFDYLRKLPTELWWDIFSLALGPFTYDLPHPSHKFSIEFRIAIPLRLSSSQSTQKYRAQLVLICKAFSPLLEQLLFSDVILRGPGKFGSFMARATTESTNHERRGQWTKGLRLDSINESTITLPGLLANFPNLRFLQFKDMNEHSLRKSVQTSGWSSNIRHLHWTDFSLAWGDLRELSAHLPRLMQLDLLYCDDGGYKGAITFSQLRRLVVSS
jgi:hypothetical protein